MAYPPPPGVAAYPRRHAHSLSGGEIEIRLAVGANRAVWGGGIGRFAGIGGTGALTLCLKPGIFSPARCSSWALRERARDHFASRLPSFAEQLGVAVPPLALSSARPAGAVAVRRAASASTGD